MAGLVLDRRDGESICIGTDVRVAVVRSRSGRVKLRVEAPDSVPVDREEIRWAKCREESEPRK